MKKAQTVEFRSEVILEDVILVLSTSFFMIINESAQGHRRLYELDQNFGARFCPEGVGWLLLSLFLPADETEFRNFIVWLEDQKIRHYKIEDRGNLRNIHSDDWPKAFEKVFWCSKSTNLTINVSYVSDNSRLLQWLNVTDWTLVLRLNFSISGNLNV